MQGGKGGPSEGEVGDQGNRKQIRASVLGLKEKSVYRTKIKSKGRLLQVRRT